MKNYCVLCGKEVKKLLWMVNFDNANGKIIKLNEIPEHNEYGLLYVGPECAKKIKKEFKIKIVN